MVMKSKICIVSTLLIGIFLSNLVVPACAYGTDTDLSTVDASFYGETGGDWAGRAVTGVGDVNGDGYDDFIIGANGYNDGGSNTGQTYLILGKESGWAMDTAISTADASFLGEDVDDNSGSAVAGVGDVNGDSYDDFIIGAYGDDDGGTYAGKTYLILGKVSGWAMDTYLSTVDASFTGEDAGDYSGDAVAGVGDFNGDGYDDFVIGAYKDEDGGTEAGQTYLILGKESGWAMDTSLSTANASFWGEDADDYSGSAVAGVGDVNNDGFDDFVIGAYKDEDGGGTYAGQTYLILGKESGWAKDTDLSNVDASFLGEDADDRSGYAVAGVGDVNYDSFDDFVIGAYGDEDGGSAYTGQTYLILGKELGWAMGTDLSTADASFWGEDEGSLSGRAVSGVGDVNKDGYDDFVIGAYQDDDAHTDAGQTYLILGKNSGWAMDTDISTADASFLGEDEYDWSGFAIAGVGDVNKDGYDDFVIGAHKDDDGGDDAGQTYLILSGEGVYPVNELFSVSVMFLVLCPIIIVFVQVKRKRH